MQLIAVLIGVSIVVFMMVRLILGDPAQILLGQAATQECVAEVRTQLGLDKDPVTQYALFVCGAVSGDLGDSIIAPRLRDDTGRVLYGVAFFVLVNLAVDVLYAVLDPRVRY